ncbi:hypothetical protein TGRH88_025280 [Toxoplasma gondii]|uniref:Uncharacterized protein n=1 Tax=Toxoplasma gondii TaxID=5811 RepID=A0A7J6KAI8_TOXGO|nr:hypothetical protein TGRH88_025280 [Toxoplasma gondii]
MAADMSKFVWRADGKQDGFLYTKAALKERESGSRWRRKQTRRTEPTPAERRKRTERRHGVGVASALAAEIKRRCQPGFFVPCRYMLPCQQYMDLYQRRSKEEHLWPHANTEGCQRRSSAAGKECGCRSGHPDMCGVWEYGDCSVCDPRSARFGDEDAAVREDNLMSGQTSGRGRAEGDQEDTNGANVSSRSRRGSESSWLTSSQGQVHINVDEPAGGNDDLQASENDVHSPENQVLPSIFDDGSRSPTPRSTGRQRLSAVDSVTFGFSPELLDSPTGIPSRTGEHSVHGVSRYGHLAAMNKYMASMQQTDFDRFFLLLLSCRRLEKNIESQNLQLELYEKGYGRTAITEILGSSKASAGTKAKSEPAGKAGAQGGKGRVTESPSPTTTPLGNKTANIFQNGAQKAGASLARPLLQTSQATQEPGHPPLLKTPQGPVVRSEKPILNTKVPLTNTSAKLPIAKTKVPLTNTSAKLPIAKTNVPLTNTSAKLPIAKTKVPLTNTSAKLPIAKTNVPLTNTSVKLPIAKTNVPLTNTSVKLPTLKTKVPLTNISAKLPVSAAGGTPVKSGVGAKPKIPLCKKMGKVSEG